MCVPGGGLFPDRIDLPPLATLCNTKRGDMRADWSSDERQGAKVSNEVATTRDSGHSRGRVPRWVVQQGRACGRPAAGLTNVECGAIGAVGLLALAAHNVHQIVNAGHRVAIARARAVWEAGGHHDFGLEPHQALCKVGEGTEEGRGQREGVTQDDARTAAQTARASSDGRPRSNATYQAIHCLGCASMWVRVRSGQRTYPCRAPTTRQRSGTCQP